MDVPVPLKWYMHSNWHEDYQRIEGLIFEKFGVPHDRITQLNVHGMDKRVIEYEMEANNTSMKYPDSKNMPPSIKEELRQSYRWDLQDSYLPLEWLAQVQQIAREAGYFVPPLALE